MSFLELITFLLSIFGYINDFVNFIKMFRKFIYKKAKEQ